MSRKTILLSVTAVVLQVLASTSWATTISFQGLGDLPGGNFYSIAMDVSADGSAVVGFSSSGTNNEAFRWTQATGIQSLGDLPGGQFESSASAVSDDGAVVVGISDSGADPWGEEAFRWTSSGGIEGLGFLIPQTHSGAHGVSGDGSVIVGYSTDSVGSVAEPFR